MVSRRRAAVIRRGRGHDGIVWRSVSRAGSTNPDKTA